MVRLVTAVERLQGVWSVVLLCSFMMMLVVVEGFMLPLPFSFQRLTMVASGKTPALQKSKGRDKFTLIRMMNDMSMNNQGGLNVNNQQGGMGDQMPAPQIERSTTPSRYDICRMYVTGVIGTEPKETYLANGHYVINFALATTGHFTAQHEWERYKPTDTMWLSSEIWDEEAKKGLNEGIIRKGAKFAGLGTLIFNKWQDKLTGEDRKILKCRILEILDRSDIEQLGLDDSIEKKTRGVDNTAYYNNEMDQGNAQVESQLQMASSSIDGEAAGNEGKGGQQKSDIMPEDVWGAPRQRKLRENVNGDFDGFEGDDENDDERDPRIPF